MKEILFFSILYIVSCTYRKKEDEPEILKITVKETVAICKLNVMKVDFWDIEGNSQKSTLFFDDMTLKLDKIEKYFEFNWDDKTGVFESNRESARLRKIEKIDKPLVEIELNLADKDKDKESNAEQKTTKLKLISKFSNYKMTLLMHHRSKDLGDSYSISINETVTNQNFYIKFIVNAEDPNKDAFRNIVSEIFDIDLKNNETYFK